MKPLGLGPREPGFDAGARSLPAREEEKEQQLPVSDGVRIEGNTRQDPGIMSREMAARFTSTTAAALFGTRSPACTFLGGEAKQIRPVKYGPDREHPRGCWKVHNLNDRGGSSRVLDLDAPGRRVFFDYNDQLLWLKHFPFERWRRVEDGWLGETVVQSKDPQNPAVSSLFSAFLGDGGQFEMAVIDCARDGGCTAYRLDTGSYRKDPSLPPPVTDIHIFQPSEALSTSPFPLHTSLGRTDTDRTLQFLQGREFEVQYEPPGELFGKCGWRLKVNRPIDSSDLEGFLDARSSEGTVAETKDPISWREFRYTRWEKTVEGWQNIEEGKIPPEQADVLSSCELKTVLKNDGTLSMKLYEHYYDSRCRVTELDGGSFLKEPLKLPAILGERFIEEGTEDNVRVEIPGSSVTFGPGGAEDLEHEGDWIIIGDQKLAVNKAREE